jgi:hypothetical protein
MQKSEQTKGRGGHNKEIILLNIHTFKMLCLKAGTKKAHEIHEYYVKLEETLHDMIQEETNELKLQLESTQMQLESSEKEKNSIREKTLLEQFPNNTQCVYYGFIDNKSLQGEKLIKFGNSNNLRNRVKKHKETYIHFSLVNAFQVENKVQIESAMKNHPLFQERQRTISIKNKNYIELLSIEDIDCSVIDKALKEIIAEIEFSPENYKKLLDENKLLKRQIKEKNDFSHNHEWILLQEENKRLKKDNLKLMLKIQKKGPFHENENKKDPITDHSIENYQKIMNQKYYTKNKDGSYNIDGKRYNSLEGTRQDVWNETSFKTSGGLLKKDLTMNRYGRIVSKKKCIHKFNCLIYFKLIYIEIILNKS